MYYYDGYYNYVPYQYSIGQQSNEFEAPQEDFFRPPVSNGSRVKDPIRPEVYLVDHGRIRLIVSTAVYHGIFRDWEGLIPVGLQNYPKGPPLREGTFLFKYKDSPTVYLRDWENGRTQVKRRIVSPNAFNRWHFDWKKIKEMPRATFYLPDGTDIR
ncbi:hypothetical protein AAIE21_26205 [Paenibacillus sp. 102]|uniref:hypothetical protein n=1 Tax=Paenibacillus sp. 102 TaxID=3120823 RepID=UPI0031BABDCB